MGEPRHSIVMVNKRAVTEFSLDGFGSSQMVKNIKWKGADVALGYDSLLCNPYGSIKPKSTKDCQISLWDTQY